MKGAIIGFGKIAETTHMGALDAAGLDVAAIVEAHVGRREAARQALPKGAVYESVAELLAGPKLDFVDICTPPHLHFEAAAAAIEAGLHVLCEKPLVLDAAQGDELDRLAGKRGVVVTCMHNWTQAPILARARELVGSGRWGSLKRAELVTLRTEPAGVAGDTANWRIDPSKAGGGILFDHGWHGMSILLRAVARRPLRVTGVAENRRFRDLPVEDTSETSIVFEDGTEGRFFATWAADERKNRATFACEGATIELEDDLLRVRQGAAVIQEERFEESLAGGGYRPTWTAAIAREFRREVEGSSRGRSLDEALTCLKLLLSTYESARRGSVPVDLA